MAEVSAAGLPGPAERGTLVIADRVVERIAAIAAREVETVSDRTSGWAKVTRRALPRATAKVSGTRTRIGVQVAAAWPTPLPTMAALVRDHVGERVGTLTGIDVTAVDVTVADVVQEQSSRRRVE